MRRLVAMLLMIGGLVMLAIPATAQGPVIRLDPEVVPAVATEVTVVVSGSGFATDGFVLVCDDAGPDAAAALADPQGNCDLGNLMPYAPVDGVWSVPITFVVTESMIDVGGVPILASDAAGDDAAVSVLVVADALSGAEPLPTTGSSSAYMAMGAVNMIAFGALMMLADTRGATAR